MTTFKNANKTALALMAVAVILGGLLAPAMFNQNAFADVTKTIADAQNAATGQALYAGSITLYGQKFTNAAIADLQEIDCMSVSMRKGGSPTGTATIGIFDSSSRALLYTFGTKDVSTLTTSYVVSEYCNTGSDGYLFDAASSTGTVVFAGVSYSGGDVNNSIDVRRSNTGSGPEYDGGASFHANYDGSWHNYDSNSRDLLFKLTNTDTTPGAFCNQLPVDDGAFWDSSTYWQNNGVGRCAIETAEDKGGKTQVDAGLSGATLTIDTFTTYFDDTTRLRGLQLQAVENSNVLGSTYSSGNGLGQIIVSGLSAGSHTVVITNGGGFNYQQYCDVIGSGITCEDLADYHEAVLTFTVA